jgi:hypothetical protein
MPSLGGCATASSLLGLSGTDVSWLDSDTTELAIHSSSALASLDTRTSAFVKLAGTLNAVGSVTSSTLSSNGRSGAQARRTRLRGDERQARRNKTRMAIYRNRQGGTKASPQSRTAACTNGSDACWWPQRPVSHAAAW